MAATNAGLEGEIIEASENAGELTVLPAGGKLAEWVEPGGGRINPALAYIASLQSKASRKTMSSYLSVVARELGAASLEDCNWSILRRHHVQAIISRLSETRVHTTVNAYLAALKGVCFEAWADKQMDADSFAMIKAVKPVKGVRLPSGRALSAEEVIALIEYCERDRGPAGVRDAAILSIMAGCGLRRSELISLDISSINWKEGYLAIKGKGNKERKAYLPDKTKERLWLWVEDVRGDHAGPLFSRVLKSGDIHPNGLSSQGVQHILNRIRLGASSDEFTPHDLRRTFATLLFNAGEDMVTVREAMGHSSISTTELYVRHSEEKLKVAAQKVSF